jgi:hypothetical protein
MLFDADMRILSPDSLAKDVFADLQRAINNYEGNKAKEGSGHEF